MKRRVRIPRPRINLNRLLAPFSGLPFWSCDVTEELDFRHGATFLSGRRWLSCQLWIFGVDWPIR